MPAGIVYSLWRGRGGSLDCTWGVQTHSGPLVILVPFHNDLARLNGTPRPIQKLPLALGNEPGSLDHEPQPLTIEPCLTTKMWRNEPVNQYFVWHGPCLLFWFRCGILPMWDGTGLIGITVVPSSFFSFLILWVEVSCSGLIRLSRVSGIRLWDDA